MGNNYNTGDQPVNEVTAHKGAASGYAGLDANSIGAQAPKSHDLSGASHSNLTRPTAAIAQSFPRTQSMGNNGGLATGIEAVQGLVVASGKSVEFASFFAETNALSAGVHQWFTLRDSSLNLLARTGDDLDTAWAGSTTEKKLPFCRTVTDAVATSGSAVITSATGAFTAADVGRRIMFVGAAAAGGLLGKSSSVVTILSADSATQITVSANAGTSVASAGTLYIGTKYTTLTEDLYYVGIMIAATVPTLTGNAGTAASSGINALSPALYGRDGSHTGLTTPATAVTPLVMGTTFASNVYCYLS